MRLNASGEEVTQPQPEIHHISANRMEHFQLLHVGIIESMQDCYVMAGMFTQCESGDRSARTKQEGKGSECKL